MVARFISGKSIEGALRYNEDKVRKGRADCIGVSGYPMDKEQLSFHGKLRRLNNLAALNERVKTNCVHISLNFDPSENLTDKLLCNIADTYMRETGFSGQPYVVYRHHDAAHPHIHLVSTNIQPDGKRISLHNIGRNQSEEARKKIEQMFGLVPAESHKKTNEIYLKPIAAEKAVYGKSETKAAISNVVREVIRSWKFTSLAEYNAILKRYNVAADGGQVGTKMQEKGGLVYSILDEDGNKTGVPIKASAIYMKPTLPNLEKHFENSKEARGPYRYRIKNCIDGALSSPSLNTREELAQILSENSIQVVFRENAEGRTYGVTFLDLQAKVVFNGSDLGKAYSASNILKRISPQAKAEQLSQLENEKWVAEVLRQANFKKGFASVIAQLYAKGLRIKVSADEEGNRIFLLGHYQSPAEQFVPANPKIAAYLQVNHYSETLASKLNNQMQSNPFISPATQIPFLEGLVKDMLLVEWGNENNYANQQKKKRKRHKTNW